MTMRTSLALAALTALIGCGPSEEVLEDLDAGTDASIDAGPTEPDAGVEPDAGPEPRPDAGTDAGPPLPACPEDWTAPADPTLGRWDESFSMPGVGGTAPTDALALAVGPAGELYIGGTFSHAGSTPANDVVRWTATGGWEPLGAGIDGDVWALAVHPSGSPVYAAAQMHDTYESAILAWDGTSWSELARAGGSSMVYELAVGADGSLYVGGSFEGIGGDATIANLAVWNGAAWSSLGGSPDRQVSALLVDASGVCIGGMFENVGTTPAQNVACWSGSTWTAYDIPAMFYEVRVLARDPSGRLIAGGHFEIATDGSEGGSLARWNGSRWESIGGGTHTFPGAPGYVEGIAFVGDDMYVAGYFVAVGPTATATLVSDVAMWDGATWHDVGGGAHREMGIGLIEQNVQRLVAYGGSVYISGMFTAVGSQSASHVAMWDGTYWSALRAPGQIDGAINGTVNALAARGDCGVYAGGFFNYAGDVVANNVARFDGARWHALGDGIEGTVNALAVGEDGTLFAGGDFIGPGYYHLAQWDGSAWSAVGGNVMAPVYALAVDADGNLYVSGEFEVAGDIAASKIAMWDGTSWHALGAGLDQPANSIVFSPEGHVVVAGNFENAGGAPAMHVARWDGTSWSAYGDGLAGFSGVSDLAFLDGQLVASGNFDALSDGGRGVAVWDGSAWTSLGGGLYSQYSWSPPYVQGIVSVGGVLFAVGNFSLASGEEAVRAAYYDGTRWTGMGQGLNDVGSAILATEAGVWFGGSFTKADTTPSVAIALYRFGT